MNSSNISLATTALDSFWEEDKNLVALGEWCKINTSHKFIDTVPYIWNNSSKKVDAINYTLNVYDILIEELTVLLNLFHGISQSRIYWELIIGNWLMTFIQAVYNRYLTIRDFISLYPDFSTVLLDKSSYITPMEYNDFTNRVTQSDVYNLQLYSQILDYLNYDFKTKKYHNNQILSLKSSRNNFKKKLLFKILNSFSIGSDITITSPYFDHGLISYLNLYLKSKCKVCYDDFEDDFEFKFIINKNDRNHLFKDNQRGDEFISLLYNLFAVNFPILFLEGYKDFYNFVSKLEKPKSKLFATTNALHGNYIYKFYMAKEHKNIKIVSIQHGGNYGTDIISSAEYYEKNVSDYFFTFGWGAKENDINCSHEKINIKFNSKKDGDIVFISTGDPRYDFRINIVYTSSLVKTDYIPTIENFLKNITNLDLFLYRPYSKDYGFKISENIKKKFPSLRIENDRLKLKDRLKKSRLLISDHFGTSVLETLAQNYPTVIFLNRLHFKFRKPEIISLLEDAKILFYDEVAAAKHINNINEDIDSWWLSPKVQKAREKFCYYYARTSDDWAEDWMKEFNNILEENARNNS
ncbi:LIC12162 family protein [Aliarcobacter skirrowii]|uniref:LIC12162 family transferase n=1 Tax=Aliarcobacter skirrowii TaxID=28200 RepID=UPI0029BBA113|nr:LIC12162 family protein [Aliarcobacter skirrowii]MDX4063848.1 LIC12162 family protein [Aliarcobacter skirrowii]